MMQRQIVETVNGRLVHRYEDVGPSRTKRHLEPMASGYRLPDFKYPHPATQVSRDKP